MPNGDAIPVNDTQDAQAIKQANIQAIRTYLTQGIKDPAVTVGQLLDSVQKNEANRKG